MKTDADDLGKSLPREIIIIIIIILCYNKKTSLKERRGDHGLRKSFDN